MIKGAPVITEATAIPGASATTEVQKYPAKVQKYPELGLAILWAPNRMGQALVFSMQ